MKIIVDAFGGDNAPLEIIKGCIEAKKEFGVDIMLTGDRDKIEKCAKDNSLDISPFEIKQADTVFEMTTPPTEILKSKRGTSLGVGLDALASGEGDAFVSAGSTGALLVGGTLIVKRIKGVKRPALGAVMPTSAGPFILVDTGANVECTPDMFCQFAKLGSLYMEKIMGVASPRVALANIGTEETKGTPMLVETYKKLNILNGINFTGNIEVRDIAFGEADVVVADGFTGNVIVKMYEGVAKSITNQIKAIFMKNLLSKLSYLGIKSGMDEFKEKMNYKKYGGAPLIGVRKPVIKAHGSSDAYALKNAIGQAIKYIDSGFIDIVSQSMKDGENND